jgi:hypothetical protein
MQLVTCSWMFYERTVIKGVYAEVGLSNIILEMCKVIITN